jgi:RNA polymerase sigma-70 factor (ECF subfamily)
MNEPPASAGFPTTRWSRVARAVGPPTPEARAALAELCCAYWYPIYALIRRKGHGADLAVDLTQEYFARLLEKRTVASADPVTGRFRSFLFADCSFFLADRRDRDRALKRGGGRPALSIDARDAEGRFLREPSHNQTPERSFDRDWALSLIARVFDRLERHYGEKGRSDLFRRLKPLVSSDPNASSRAVVAAELGMTEGNVRVAIHRLRARFAAGLREEVAATLAEAGDDAVEEELRALCTTLGS